MKQRLEQCYRLQIGAEIILQLMSEYLKQIVIIVYTRTIVGTNSTSRFLTVHYVAYESPLVK